MIGLKEGGFCQVGTSEIGNDEDNCPVGGIVGFRCTPKRSDSDAEFKASDSDVEFDFSDDETPNTSNTKIDPLEVFSKNTYARV